MGNGGGNVLWSCRYKMLLNIRRKICLPFKRFRIFSRPREENCENFSVSLNTLVITWRCIEAVFYNFLLYERRNQHYRDYQKEKTMWSAIRESPYFPQDHHRVIKFFRTEEVTGEITRKLNSSWQSQIRRREIAPRAAKLYPKSRNYAQSGEITPVAAKLHPGSQSQTQCREIILGEPKLDSRQRDYRPRCFWYSALFRRGSEWLEGNVRFDSYTAGTGVN